MRGFGVDQVHCTTVQKAKQAWRQGRHVATPSTNHPVSSDDNGGSSESQYLDRVADALLRCRYPDFSSFFWMFDFIHFSFFHEVFRLDYFVFLIFF